MMDNNTVTLTIKISETERYSLSLTNELDRVGVETLSNRLSWILKMMGRDPIFTAATGKDISSPNKVGRPRKESTNTLPPVVYRGKLYARLRKDRALYVKLLKAFYSGNDEYAQKIIKEEGLEMWYSNRADIRGRGYLKAVGVFFEDVTPQEVGLKEWIGLGGKVDSLRLPLTD